MHGRIVGDEGQVHVSFGPCQDSGNASNRSPVHEK